MSFENIGKLKIHLGAGGSIESAENGRGAILALIGEIEVLRGQVEAQKLMLEDLARRVVTSPGPSA